MKIISPLPSNSLLLTASNSWDRSSQLPLNVREVSTPVLDRFQCRETRIKMRVCFTSASAQVASLPLWTRTTTSSRKICSRKRHNTCKGSKKLSTRCTFSKIWWCKRRCSRVRVALVNHYRHRFNNSISWLSQSFLLKLCTNSYQTTTSSNSWPCKDNNNSRLLPPRFWHNNLRRLLVRSQLITISNGFKPPQIQLVAPALPLWLLSNPSNQPRLTLFQTILQRRPSLQVLLVFRTIHKFWRHRESHRQRLQLLGSDKRRQSDNSSRLTQLSK